MPHHRRLILATACLLALTACSSDAAGIRQQSTTVPTAPPASSVPATTQRSATVAPRVDPLQVAGSWLVKAVTPGFLFTEGDHVTFSGEGSFSVTGRGVVRSGTWKVVGSQLELGADGRVYDYEVTAKPRELHLDTTAGSGMTLVRA